MIDGRKEDLTLENIFSNHYFDAQKWGGFQKELLPDVRSVIEDFIHTKLDDEDFHYSLNKKYILFYRNKQSLYRHSFFSEVFLLQLESTEIIQIDKEPIAQASFSPAEDFVVYVKNNNLFLFDLTTQQSDAITTDGKKNEIINGMCDWVYEEEFGFTQAYQWNNDGSQIAYYRFDESLVKEYTMTTYDDDDNQFFQYKYPKAGEKNATVSILIYDFVQKNKQIVSISSGDGYIPKITWSDTKNLLIFHVNRHQNHLQIWSWDAPKRQQKLYYQELNERYIDFQNECYSPFENEMIFTSEKEGFRNIYLYKESIEQRLTDNQQEVDTIISIDTKNKWIYYSLAFPSPMERQIFVTDFAGNTKQLTNKIGWHHCTISKDLTEAVISYSDVNAPPIWTKYAIQKDATTKLPYFAEENMLLQNQALQLKIEKLNLPQTEWITVPNRNGERINGWILKPKDFNDKKSYPLLFCNYGGPGHQTVTNQFGSIAFWQYYLVQQGFILVSFDNTGTGGRGEDFKKKTYLQLGKYEIEDQIDIAQKLSQLSYIDDTRIGHWGWSFGGFMSSLAISKGADIFSYAIAVAPVTNWKYYDTIYTERYMRTPQENPEGYTDNSPFHYTTDKIKGDLLLIHGSADDNVHVQHSMQWIKHLIKENIAFDMAIYPDKNHRINGGNTSYHLWQRMTKWLSEKILKK